MAEREIQFYIDDLEYFRHIYKLNDKQFESIFGGMESFKAMYTIIGDTNGNMDRYILTDYNGNKIDINSLNGYQRGVVLADCVRYFEGKLKEPSGVVKIIQSSTPETCASLWEKRYMAKPMRVYVEETI